MRWRRFLSLNNIAQAWALRRWLNTEIGRCVRAMSMGMLTSLHWFFSLDCCKSSPLFSVFDWNFLSHFFSFFAQDNLKLYFFPHKNLFSLWFIFLCNTLFFALFLLAFFHRDFLVIFTQKMYFTSLRLSSALTRSQLKLFWPALARMHGSILSNWKRRLGRAEETCTKWRRKSVKMSRSRRLVLCRERERERAWLAMKLEGAWLCQRWLTACNLNLERNGRLTRGVANDNIRPYFS